jgi:hypothetical protein
MERHLNKVSQLIAARDGNWRNELKMNLQKAKRIIFTRFKE